MFVLSNAWRALTRSKGRTALTAFITLAVTFGTVAGLAIIQEDTKDVYKRQESCPTKSPLQSQESHRIRQFRPQKSGRLSVKFEYVPNAV